MSKVDKPTIVMFAAAIVLMTPMIAVIDDPSWVPICSWLAGLLAGVAFYRCCLILIN